MMMADINLCSLIWFTHREVALMYFIGSLYMTFLIRKPSKSEDIPIIRLSKALSLLWMLKLFDNILLLMQLRGHCFVQDLTSCSPPMMELPQRFIFTSLSVFAFFISETESAIGPCLGLYVSTQATSNFWEDITFCPPTNLGNNSIDNRRRFWLPFRFETSSIFAQGSNKGS